MYCHSSFPLLTSERLDGPLVAHFTWSVLCLKRGCNQGVYLTCGKWVKFFHGIRIDLWVNMISLLNIECC